MENTQIKFKDVVCENTQKILNFIDIKAKINILEKSTGDQCQIFWVKIESEEPGFLIGQKGNNLKALQHLISLMVYKNISHDDCSKLRIIIDVNNYRLNRLEFLKKIAVLNYKKVVGTQQVVVLEPMSAYERRVIHLTLQSKNNIQTESLGEEPNRRVVIKFKQ